MRRIMTDDYSGVEKYLDNDKNHVKIPIVDCLLVDDCRLNYDHTLAIVKTGERMLLLGKCSMGTRGYIYCNTKLLMELSYTTLEEALADTYWSSYAEKELREIDSLAYGLYCDYIVKRIFCSDSDAKANSSLPVTCPLPTILVDVC